ncbi:hypothetical protein [Roseixanthobacter liquoris]|uniref:hypothetical protein n=1 Tax=Roseixanthobacter liquoris TaxID=3119921 RepID=UPI0037286DA4
MAYKFEIKRGVAIPATARFGTTALPFPWDDMKEVAGDGMIEVTKDFWVNERGYDPETYTVVKARERIRGHFRNWQEKDESRKDLMLVMRTVGDDVHVWVDKPETEAVEPEGPAAPEEKAPEPAPAAPKGRAKKTTAK